MQSKFRYLEPFRHNSSMTDRWTDRHSCSKFCT